MNLSDLMKTIGVSQYELAKQSIINRNRIQLIGSGFARPTKDEEERLIRTLKILAKNKIKKLEELIKAN